MLPLSLVSFPFRLFFSLVPFLCGDRLQAGLGSAGWMASDYAAVQAGEDWSVPLDG